MDQWQAWFNRNFEKPDTTDASYGDPPLIDLPPAEKDRTDLAAQGLLKLLVNLRIVLLQDSVLLRIEFPQHPIWRDPIFLREDYLRFAHDVELSVRDIEEPDELRLRRVMPDIINRLNLNREDIVRSVDRNDSLFEGIFHRLEDLFAGRDGDYGCEVRILDNNKQTIGWQVHTDCSIAHPLSMEIKLENPFVITPEARGDYVQFTVGSVSWPFSQGGPQEPNCNVGDWDGCDDPAVSALLDIEHVEADPCWKPAKCRDTCGILIFDYIPTILCLQYRQMDCSFPCTWGGGHCSDGFYWSMN